MRRSELPLASELPAFEDDPAMFDPSPEWFVSGLRTSFGEDEEPDDGLGFRSLFEQPEVLSKAWPTSRRERTRARRRRANSRRA